MDIGKIASKVAAEPPMNIEVLEVTYDPGDKRSYGQMKFKARTPFGILECEGMIDSSSSLEEVKLTLDGKDVGSSVTGLDEPDPGFPHFYASSRLKARVNEKEQVLEAVQEWCEGYKEYFEEEAFKGNP